jgi:hypothetical protein
MAFSSWKAFLQNHLTTLVSVDFFPVPTLRFQILYVLRELSASLRKWGRFIPGGESASPSSVFGEQGIHIIADTVP